MIGAFDDASRVVTLDEDDQSRYTGWEVTNKQSFQQEMVEFLTWHVSTPALLPSPGFRFYASRILCLLGYRQALWQHTPLAIGMLSNHFHAAWRPTNLFVALLSVQELRGRAEAEFNNSCCTIS